MGVIYKLKDEVVQFIISQRQENPLFSCRQLAESASLKFNLHFSKSSVHDVLKDSGITTPRGRKPKDKFEIPQEKKKQIQDSLSQVKLLTPPTISTPKAEQILISPPENKPQLIADIVETKNSLPEPISSTVIPAKAGIQDKMDPRFRGDDAVQIETSPEYEGAGKIFLKAALWDLGIFTEENIKTSDWDYYLTYTKGIEVVLENSKKFFLDLHLPLERCVREMADGLINNIKPFIVHKVSDEELFKACMEAQTGFKIDNISIVDEFDHILLKLDNIMEFKRNFLSKNRIFVESNEFNLNERSKAVFFSQNIKNNGVMDDVLNLKGFDCISKNESVVTLLISECYENKGLLQAAVEKLNSMYLYDDKDRLVKVKIQAS